MKITVEQLIAQFKNNEMKCIAGFSGLQRTINSFTIIDTPEITKWLKGGEFVASVGYVTNSNPKMKKTLIPDLVAKGCAGLGVKMHSYYDEIPQEYIEYGNLYGFPIIEMAYEMKFSDLAFIIHKNLFKYELNKAEIGYDIFQKLMNLIINNDSVEHMLFEISLVLGNPSILVTEDIKVLAYEIPEENISKISNNITKKHLFDSIEVISKNATKFFEETHLNTYHNVISIDGSDQPYSLYTITSNREALGYLLILEMDKTKLGENNVVIETILSALALYFLKIKMLPDIEREQNTFLKTVLQNPQNDMDLIRKKCSQFGFEQSMERVCINVIIGESHLWSYELKRTTRSLVEIIFTNICSEMGIHKYSMWNNNNFISYLFFPESMGQDDVKTMIQEISGKILKQFNENELHAYLGISSIGRETSHIIQSYKEAVNVIPLGNKVNPTEKIHNFEELRIYYLLNLSASRDELKSYTSCLSPLLNSDKELQTEYLRTLEMIINTNFNLTKAAKEMFIHRNSIIYRFNKIKELINIDFENPAELLKVQIAIHSLKLL